MLEYYLEFWTNYFNFQGRARRAAYWYTWLMNFIVVTILSILKTYVPQFSFLYGLYGFASIIPQISLSVRRLHDTGKTGWWLLLQLLPIGSIIFVNSNLFLMALLGLGLTPMVVLIFFFCQDSDIWNDYGPSPKYSSEPESEEKSQFYKGTRSEQKPEQSFYNRDAIQPKEETGFYKEGVIKKKEERSF